MSGAERRRRKAQRRMACQAVQEYPVLLREVGSRMLDLHRYASIRARNLRTREGEKMSATADLCRRAQALEHDLLAAADLMEDVFVRRSATPESLDLSAEDVRTRAHNVRLTIADIRRIVGLGALSSEVRDTAARSVAAAYGIPAHRLVWTRYCRGGRSRTGEKARSIAIGCLAPLLLVSTACLSPFGEGEAAPEPDYYTPPARVVLMFDQTGSVGVNRVEQPGVDDLAPMFEVLWRVSGELAIGSISDDSNRTLLRLPFDLPPTPPEEPPKRGNAFILAGLREDYAEVKAEYDASLDVWASQTESRIVDYRERAESLLARPANARHTDVWGALRRARSFLDEPTPQW